MTQQQRHKDKEFVPSFVYPSIVGSNITVAYLLRLEPSERATSRTSDVPGSSVLHGYASAHLIFLRLDVLNNLNKTEILFPAEDSRSSERAIYVFMLKGKLRFFPSCSQTITRTAPAGRTERRNESSSM